MDRFKYLIIGGGMAAAAAVKGIRAADSTGTVAIVTADVDPPYKRPPLSKKLWAGKPEESIWFNTGELGVTMLLGRTVTALDAPAKRVTDDQGNEYGYEKLLIATGGSPIRLPDGDDIIYYRSFRDYKRLRELADKHERFIIIGGGFIGSEVAAALAMNKKHVTMMFPGTGIGARIYPKELATFLVDYYREHGVEVLAGDVAAAVEQQDGRLIVRTQSRRVLEADGIVAGIGITPNTDLAQAAGLTVDNGIVVDEYLGVGLPDVYAAGDVARFYNPTLDRRMRVEHEDNALTMGEYAGSNMAGEQRPYHYLPYFYSDLFDLGYEAVGELDTSVNDVFVDWKTPFQEGVIYYLREGRVRGVLLWNVWDKVPAARELIAEPGPFDENNLRGRITN